MELSARCFQLTELLLQLLYLLVVLLDNPLKPRFLLDHSLVDEFHGVLGLLHCRDVSCEVLSMLAQRRFGLQDTCAKACAATMGVIFMIRVSS